MGISKDVPYEYIHRGMGGLGLPHIYIMQGIAHIIAMMTHCSKDTQIGMMLIAQMELCNIEIGSGDHLFYLPYSLFSPSLTHCWMKST